ncbi:MAG: class I SAM-dependent methyltransferase [Spirochaetales bacterium]|nr:class I SAM-dependent methyltransferase [Spirochaetales bacterium]
MKSEADKILSEIDKDSFRQNLCRYTWQAFHMLPEIEQPSILDLGCGSGIPAIELAILSKGLITAVDMDKGALAVLKDKVKALDLTNHIKVVRGDITKLKCKKAHFDIVWSEGAISAVGFEKGLETWRDFVKPGGFMVIHDEIKEYKRKIGIIPDHGYRLIDHFIISGDIWFREYFRPLEQRINQMKNEYKLKPHILRLLQKEECEIEQFTMNPNEFASVFYIMKNV